MVAGSAARWSWTAVCALTTSTRRRLAMLNFERCVSRLIQLLSAIFVAMSTHWQSNFRCDWTRSHCYLTIAGGRRTLAAIINIDDGTVFSCMSISIVRLSIIHQRCHNTLPIIVHQLQFLRTFSQSILAPFFDLFIFGNWFHVIGLFGESFYLQQNASSFSQFTYSNWYEIIFFLDFNLPNRQIVLSSIAPNVVHSRVMCPSYLVCDIFHQWTPPLASIFSNCETKTGNFRFCIYFVFIFYIVHRVHLRI